MDLRWHQLFAKRLPGGGQQLPPHLRDGECHGLCPIPADQHGNCIWRWIQQRQHIRLGRYLRPDRSLQKFSELAHRWWDPAGSFRPLHEINPLRLDWIDQRAALPGKRVLAPSEAVAGLPFAPTSTRISIRTSGRVRSPRPAYAARDSAAPR